MRSSFINNSLIYHIVEIICGRDKLIEHYFQTEGKIGLYFHKIVPRKIESGG